MRRPVPRLAGRLPCSPVARAGTIGALVALVLCLLFVGLVTLEPARAIIWQARGAQCGAIAFGLGNRPTQDTATARQRAECLAAALRQCQAAALAYSYSFGDGGTAHTFVVEPGVGPWQSCALVDTWNTQIVGGSGRSGTVYCTGLEVHPSALFVRACGDLGDITVPFDSLR